MMNNTRSSAKSSWKYLIFVPLMIISIPSLNATYDTKNINKQITDHQNNKMKVHRSLITKEIYFANLSLKKLVSIDNVTGKISVQGYNGKSVKVEIEKIITATSDKELKRGIEETKVKTIDLDQEKYLYLGTPYSKFDTTSKTFSYKNNCGNNSCFEYKFELHYKILVPFNTSLRLSTINGGNIVVTGVKGEQLVVKHISGSITLKDISFETTDVFTISGDIKGSYIENPTQQSSYVTTSGNIDIDYVTGLDATVTYEIKDGRLVTDFMAESINTKNTSHVNKPIKSSVKIGSGNVGFFFKTTSGDVSLNKS